MGRPSSASGMGNPWSPSGPSRSSSSPACRSHSHLEPLPSDSMTRRMVSSSTSHRLMGRRSSSSSEHLMWTNCPGEHSGAMLAARSTRSTTPGRSSLRYKMGHCSNRGAMGTSPLFKKVWTFKSDAKRRRRSCASSPRRSFGALLMAARPGKAGSRLGVSPAGARPAAVTDE